uniref:Uncharacterized protein n=1 Tax=Micrurus lemniscatus lemniscatus TaxID=129467 RepID=A0A2D4JKH0_MICLE
MFGNLTFKMPIVFLQQGSLKYSSVLPKNKKLVAIIKIKSSANLRSDNYRNNTIKTNSTRGCKICVKRFTYSIIINSPKDYLIQNSTLKQNGSQITGETPHGLGGTKITEHNPVGFSMRHFYHNLRFTSLEYFICDSIH